MGTGTPFGPQRRLGGGSFVAAGRGERCPDVRGMSARAAEAASESPVPPALQGFDSWRTDGKGKTLRQHQNLG